MYVEAYDPPLIVFDPIQKKERTISGHWVSSCPLVDKCCLLASNSQEGGGIVLLSYIIMKNGERHEFMDETIDADKANEFLNSITP